MPSSKVENDGEKVEKKPEIVQKSGKEQNYEMAAKAKGKIYPYVVGDNVNTYIQGVELFFALNKTPDNEKAAEFLTRVGQRTMDRIISSFKPDDVKDKSYDECKAKFKGLINKVNAFGQRYRLAARRQEISESLDDFAIALRDLAENTETTDAEAKVLLTSVFVAGVRSKKTREGILKDAKVSDNLDALLDMAKRFEEAEQEASAMEKEVESINRVYQKPEVSKEAGGWRSQSAGSANMSAYRGPSTSTTVRCFRCQQVGHYKSECNNQPGWKKKPKFSGAGRQSMARKIHSITQALQELAADDDNSEEDTMEYEQEETSGAINNMLLGERENNKPAFVEVELEDKKKLLMEIDTGACATVCSVGTYRKNFRDYRLLPCGKRFSSVSGAKIKAVGKIRVVIKARKTRIQTEIIVVESEKEFLPLLGRDLLNKLWPEWKRMFEINSFASEDEEAWRKHVVEDLKKRFPNVFDEDLREPIKDFVVDIRMEEGARPFVHKPYSVAFKHREKVGKHIDDLEKTGLLKKVEYAEWASPLVVVVKPNKVDLRVCMDASKTINPFIITHHYPVPVIDDLLANKVGAKKFVLIDLKGAYQQLLVSEATQKLLVVNTHKGLYAYRRLPFGVKPAASIFQSVMDRILSGLSNSQTYLDDILVWGKDNDELLLEVEKVLERLAKYNVKVNTEKCVWFVSKVKYLGHTLSERGIEANVDKVRAIRDAPAPKNTSQLKSFLGLVGFYAKFVPKLNESLASLHALLQKDKRWVWDEKCQQTFESCKRSLCSAKILAHYDPKKPIRISCDASDDGISGVMSHLIDGEDRPVFCVSRRLTRAEKNYPILHREALAIVYALEKFYKYVLGQKVTIFTDHKPLVGVFKGKHNPTTIANRLQRYFHRLSIFDFTIQAIKGKENYAADCLSRLPVQEKLSIADELESKRSDWTSINFLVDDKVKRLNLDLIGRETSSDEVLKAVKSYVRNGWPNGSLDCKVKNYFEKRKELDLHNECLVFGDRLVIPSNLTGQTLEILHANHRGIEKMKQLAREHFYWQGVNKDIVSFCKTCKACQELNVPTTPAVYGNWPESTTPFERVHIDFFHKNKRVFLILVDSYSRWLEVKRMSTTTAEAVEKVLDGIFSIFGFPKKIVSDNGPPFQSEGFAQYCSLRNIRHVLTPPYHPASNGLAERAVKTTKAVLNKLMHEKDSFSNSQIDESLKTFLHHHHQTPTTEDNIVPNRRIFTFAPRTELTGLKIEREKTSAVEEVNMHQEVKSEKKFRINEEVIYMKKVNGQVISSRARVIRIISKLVVEVKVNGAMCKVHHNQLKKIPQMPILSQKSNIKEKVEAREVGPQESPITITDSDSSWEDCEEELGSEEESPKSSEKNKNHVMENSTPRRSAREKKLRHSNLNENNLGLPKK